MCQKTVSYNKILKKRNISQKITNKFVISIIIKLKATTKKYIKYYKETCCPAA